jgi:hypothetical protein
MFEFGFLVLAICVALVRSQDCDTSAGLKCLTSDLTACKKITTNDPCMCAATAIACLAAAKCENNPTLLATAQLGFSGSSCEIPESAALPSAAGACSITGSSRCTSNLNTCAIRTRGANPFPQPGVCTDCVDTWFACIKSYACGAEATTKTAFNTAQGVYRCSPAIDFDMRIGAIATSASATLSSGTSTSSGSAAISSSTAPTATTTASGAASDSVTNDGHGPVFVMNFLVAIAAAAALWW